MMTFKEFRATKAAKLLMTGILLAALGLFGISLSEDAQEAVSELVEEVLGHE